MEFAFPQSGYPGLMIGTVKGQNGMMMLAYQRQDVERSLNHSGIYKDIVSLWNQVCESQA